MAFENLKVYLAQRSAEKAAKKEAHAQDKLSDYARKIAKEEDKRWGFPEEDGPHSTRAVVERYQTVMGIQHLADASNKKYLKYLQMGYFEPVPQAWANAPISPLTGPPVASFNSFDDAAEERLYWVLNNSIDLDANGVVKPKPNVMKPDQWSELRMANKRMKSAIPIDPRFNSNGDYFLANKSYKNKGYSRQVPPMEISNAFKELFANQAKARELGGQGHGTDEVDVMILIDVSSSMGWDHPFGFAQPRHVEVVHNILKRAIHHMEVRDSYASNGGAGVETVCFNSTGFSLGKVGSRIPRIRDPTLILPHPRAPKQMNYSNFENKWRMISNLVYTGGGTRVMQGWQKVKNIHFHKHGGNGKAWKDPIYGWQAGPNMAKLSLLVLLDGEAADMDEFELELLGEKWAYVTICLIGKEDCPDHHRHANELTRIAHANDHINFLDVHGRISERLVVSDVLERVYASSAPSYNEIMDPRFDLPEYSITA
ncbi:hypothetical protein MNV49_006736 [Pseudohyphozyma bogoriensis]|nr:hypothetical protein MNV49_006736 [Pseudohyphozyma bogoriensis]